MDVPNWWHKISLLRKKRILLRLIYQLNLRVNELKADILEYERELAEVEAAMDAVEDDGVNPLPEREESRGQPQ